MNVSNGEQITVTSVLICTCLLLYFNDLGELDGKTDLGRSSFDNRLPK